MPGSWSYILTQMYQMYSSTWSNSLWKKYRNQLSDSCTSGDSEKTHLKTGREGWVTITTNPTPCTVPYSWQETFNVQLLLEECRVGPHIWCPNFWGYHWRGEPPNHLVLKANKTCVQESYKTTADKGIVLNGGWALAQAPLLPLATPHPPGLSAEEEAQTHLPVLPDNPASI